MSIWDDLIQKLAFLDIEQQKSVLAFIKQIDSGQDVNRIIVFVNVAVLRTDITMATKYTRTGGQVKGMIGLIDTVTEYLNSQSDYAVDRDFAVHVLRIIGFSPLPENEANQLIVGLKVSRGEIHALIKNQADELFTQITDQTETLFTHFPMAKNPLTQKMLVLRGEFRYLHGLGQRIQEATGLKVIIE